MIIVEGYDGSGKTTLCSMMEAHHIVDKVMPSPRIRGKGDPERMVYETRRYLDVYGRNHRVAVDRFLFSEMVYGPILRGRSAITRSEYLTFLLDIMLTGSIVIFCLPDKPRFKVNENPVVIERIDQIKKAYQGCAEDSAFSTHKTYIYKWDEKDAFQRLKKFIEENR